MQTINTFTVGQLVTDDSADRHAVITSIVEQHGETYYGITYQDGTASVTLPINLTTGWVLAS